MNRKRENGMIRVMLILMLALMFMVPAGIVISDSIASQSSGAESTPLPDAQSGAGNTENTILIQPNATEGKDTYIYSRPDDQKHNFGAQEAFFVGRTASGDVRTLIQFPTDTANAEIRSATLSIYCEYVVGDPLGVNVSAHLLIEPWSEGNATNYLTDASYLDSNWINRTTGVPWGAPGGAYATSIVSYTVMSNSDAWYSFNITEAVKEWKSGSAPNYGLILTGEPVNSSSNTYVMLTSSDDTLNPAHRPKLTIIYGAEIEPTVPPITTNEDTPVDIDLGGRGHGIVEHVSAPANASDNGLPFWGGSADECRYQALYTSDEVGAEGKIVRISVNRSRTWGSFSANFSNVVIRMAHTDRTSLTETFDSNYNGFLIEVFRADNLMIESPDNDTWFSFDLNGNFTYDSAHNLLIDIQWKGDGGEFVGLQSHNTYPALRRLWNITDMTSSTGTTDEGYPVHTIPVMRFSVDVQKNGVLDKGRNGNFWPFCPSDESEMHMQMLWKSTTVGESGKVNTIFFQTYGTEAQATLENLSIRMAHSTNDSLGSNFELNHIGQWIEVLNRSSYVMSTSGDKIWMAITLDESFDYNGNDNIIIDIRWRGGTGDRIILYTEYPATYDGRAYAYPANYSGETADHDAWVYNVRFGFADSPALTWSATSSDTGLFNASVSNNTLHITPVANAYGNGTVELTLHNGAYSTTQSIPVTISPVNDAPVIGSISPITCVEDEDYILDMSLYASDVDNTIDELTFSTDSPYATVDGHNIVFNYPNGITGETVNITVEDQGSLSASATVSITVTPVNDAPVISGLPSSITCVEDTNYTLDMSLYASDVDNTMDELTFSTDSPYARVDGHNITFNYPEGILGDTVMITVEDPGQASGTARVQVSVTPVNDAPTLSPPSEIYCTESADYILNIGMYASDPDNTVDELTFSTDSSHAIVEGQNIIFKYPYGFTGENVTITAEDPGQLSGTATIQVHVLMAERPQVTEVSSEGSRITIRFDMDMDMASAESAFSMAKNGTAVTGNFVWTDARTMTFTPSSTVSGTYEIDVGTGARASTGAPMLDPYHTTYTTPAGLDSDGDGMPDSWEIANGFDPMDLSDAATDADHDGLSNYLEYITGTEPRNNDTDGDGIVDGFDAEPLTQNESAGTGTDNSNAPSSFNSIDPMMILVIVLTVIVAILAVMLAKKGGKGPGVQSQQEGYVAPQEGMGPVQQPQEFGEQPEITYEDAPSEEVTNSEEL